MFGPRQPFITNNEPWNYHRSINYDCRPNFGPRAQFRGHHQRSSTPHHYYRPHQQPENENYWCETCDRGFLTEDILNKHKQQHQKCNIDGCQFIAHPKVITKHIQMQHSSGLYKKISNINKPEEIEKWREERKKKYPTKANIDKKNALLQEKIERGEKMGLDWKKNNFKKHMQDKGVKRSINMGHENQPRTKFKRNTYNDAVKKPPASKKPLQPIPLVEDDRKLKPFAGILTLEMTSDNEIEETELCPLIEDDLIEESVSNPNISSEPVVCGALSSLICDYGSSDEENTEETSSTKCTNNSIHKVTKVTENNENKNDAVLEVNQNVENITQIEQDVTQTEPVENDIGNSVAETDNKVEVCNKVNTNGDDNDSGPEEVKVMKAEDITTQSAAPLKRPIQNKSIRKPTGMGRKHHSRTQKPKMPSTLLHKLLFKEMQQERNIVLQCIRYIIKSNYFEKNE